MSGLVAIMEALAGQISTTLCGTASPLIEDLQVDARWNSDPTPPCVDVYPSDPFQEPLGFGKANNEIRLNVRARVSKADPVGGQELLLSMMDPAATTSLTKAITRDRSLGSKVSGLGVEGPTGFGIYQDAGGQGSLLGAIWTVRLLP